jgi:hypothetical protein
MQEGCFKAGIMSSAAFTQGCISSSLQRCEQLLGVSPGVNKVAKYWPIMLDLLTGNCIGLEMIGLD